jgi:fermentation-respiration switch protein FrsA (DUF1100 family)
MRRDIEFDAEGLTLRGWLYLPDDPPAPVPTVVMAHGFSCVKEMFLDAYATTSTRPNCAPFPGHNAFESHGAPGWTNEVTLRSIEMFFEHETSGYVDKLGPTPLLMILEDHDTLAAVDQALDIYNRALEPKKLVSFSGGHFDAYARDQHAAAAAARDWYRQHLS